MPTRIAASPRNTFPPHGLPTMTMKTKPPQDLTAKKPAPKATKKSWAPITIQSAATTAIVCSLCGETAAAKGAPLTPCGTWLATMPEPAPHASDVAHLLCVAAFASARTRAELETKAPRTRRTPNTPTGPSLPSVLGADPTGRFVTVRLSVLVVTALNLLHPDTYGGVLKLTPHIASDVGTIRAYSLTAQESVLREIMAAARNRGDGSMQWRQPTQWGRACRDAAQRLHGVLNAPASSSFSF